MNRSGIVKKDVDCQINHVKVYRPEAPEGYVCLGIM